MADGQLDRTFAGAGVATVSFPGTTYSIAYGVIAQPGGGVLLGGSVNGASGALALLRADGTLDPAFGTAGRVLLPAVSLREIFAMARQPDGKVVIAGYAIGATTGEDSVVGRLLPDGTPDPAFGTGGYVRVDAANGRADRAQSVAIDTAGRVVLGGFASTADGGYRMTVQRFLPDGSPDAAFGTAGRPALAGGQGSGVTVRPLADGSIIAGCGLFNGFGAVRFTDSGTLDQTFDADGNGDGIATLPVGTARAMDVGPDGRIVLAGYDSTFAVGRMHRNGAGDGSFGRDGFATYASTPDTSGGFAAVLVQPDNRVLALQGYGSLYSPGSMTRSAALYLIDGGPAFPPFAELAADGTLDLIGTRGADVIRLAFRGGVYEATVNGEVKQFPAAAVSSVRIGADGGADRVSFDWSGSGGAAYAPVTVLAGDGDDAVTAAVGGPTFTLDGGAGSDALTVVGTAAADSIAVSATAVTGDATVAYSGLEAVTVTGGGGADTLARADTTGPAVTLKGEDGPDRLTVRSATGDGVAPTTLDGGADADAVELWGVLAAAVSVAGGTGTDAITFNGTEGDDVFECRGWSGGVVGTATFGGDVEAMTINALGGRDAVTVRSTTQFAVALNGGDGDDMLSFVSGGVSSSWLERRLTVDGGAGTDALVFDDRLYGGKRTYSLSAALMTVTALASTGSIAHAACESFRVQAGRSDDTFGVSAATVPLTLEAGDGADRLSLSSTAGMSAVAARVSFDGGAGDDAVTVTNSQDAGRDVVTVTSAGLGVSAGDTLFPAGGGLLYSDAEAVTLATSQAADLIRVLPGAATAFTVNGNTPAVPADELVVETTGAAGAVQTPGASGAGQFTFADRKPVSYSNVESARAQSGPAVGEIVLGDGSARRSRVDRITVTFDRAVTPGAGAFAVRPRAAGAAAVAVTATNPSGDGRTWTLSFGGSSVVAGSLADGFYDLLIAGASIRGTDADAPAVTGDQAMAFHRLFGDGDGDGDVDGADSRGFRTALGSASGDPSYSSAFDFDLDGDVDGADSRQFRTRLGTAL